MEQMLFLTWRTNVGGMRTGKSIVVWDAVRAFCKCFLPTKTVQSAANNVYGNKAKVKFILCGKFHPQDVTA